jgi:hypothetical protein
VLVLLLGALAVWTIPGHVGRHGSASGPATTTSTRAAVSTTTTTTAPYEPPPVVTSIRPALAGEGQWTPADTWDPGPSSILTTTFRPDPSQPSIVAYAAWVRTATTQLAL